MKIYNSLKRAKEELKPIKEGYIGMYVCGPTVYDEPHIGHARSAYIFDVIRRYFAYKGLKVKFVRNVTDVDDKIIEKARRETGNGERVDLKETTKEIAKKYLDAYHEDMAFLGIEDPAEEPKATEYIPKMVKFIALLIKRGCAYDVDGDVYFDIKKAANYGKLSKQSLDRMEVGARVAPGEKKRDPLDFALWKAVKEGEPSWPSPWGNGRPGWHIECSVMSSDILGEEFDIHGGGIDLIFPHHENEIAQSEGAGKKFARIWIHNGLLTINGEKMAKSLGNYITIKGFLAKHGDPDYLKLLYLSAHYRSPVDYTEEKILEAKKEKERIMILLARIDRIEAHDAKRMAHDGHIALFRKKFEEAMDDDFNTPLALAAIFDIVTHTNKMIDDAGEDKSIIKELLGARDLILELTGTLGVDLLKAKKEALGSDMADKIEARNAARKAGDFKKADDIRRELSGRGIILEDTKDGTTWRRKI